MPQLWLFGGGGVTPIDGNSFCLSDLRQTYILHSDLSLLLDPTSQKNSGLAHGMVIPVVPALTSHKRHALWTSTSWAETALNPVEVTMAA